MRVLVDAIRPREQRKDAVKIDDWAEENPNAWVVDQEHESVRDPIIPVAVKRRIYDTFDQLLEATDLS